MQQAAVDFETKKIEDRPVYPPRPVGVAIYAGRQRRYYAWGHPTENNCTKAEAIKALRPVYRDYECVFHNAAFDIEVGEVHLGLRRPAVFHDTVFLAYLVDPRFDNLQLKWLADTLLDMPPDEQEELRDWILANVPEAAAKPKQWGAYISEAPGKLVGKYAIGDVVRTLKLFRLLWGQVKRQGMMPAYDREIAVTHIKLKMEQHGLNTANKRLKRDLPKFLKAQELLEQRIRKRLKITKRYEATCPKGWFNIGSGQQLADALEHAGKVDPDGWIYTEPSKKHPDGQRSTKMDNLRLVCRDKPLLIDLGMRSVMDTYINTFIKPWIATGDAAQGFIHPTFNQVRTTDEHAGGGTFGTKTGRPSSTNPNFNNIPANVMESKNKDVLLALAKLLQQTQGLKFLGLRDYIVPDPGCVLIARDYSQQEVRVLAHYEDGLLLEMYIDDPNLDVHTMVQELIYERLGIEFPRKAIKIVAFTIIYGGGAAKVAFELDCPKQEAQTIMSAYLGVLPGIRSLKKELTKMGRKGEMIKTWGGRWYSCEEPKFIKGQMRTFEYKLLNLLIQGSSADITKQAMVQVDRVIEGDIRLQVYDELLVNTPKEHMRHDMPLMKREMEAIDLDLALPTDGEWSAQSWGRMKPWRD